MIELSKKYKCKLAAGDVCFVGEKDGYVFGTVGTKGEYGGITGCVWMKSDGLSVSYHGANFDLIEVKPSAIEEMIAYIEDGISVSGRERDQCRAISFGILLLEARRIRDSNATSDE